MCAYLAIYLPKYLSTYLPTSLPTVDSGWIREPYSTDP